MSDKPLQDSEETIQQEDKLLASTREIIESMDYSGGINWNKMLPPEDDRWEHIWIRKEAVHELHDIFEKSLDNLTAYHGGNQDSKFLSPRVVASLLTKVRTEIFGKVEED